MGAWVLGQVGLGGTGRCFGAGVLGHDPPDEVAAGHYLLQTFFESSERTLVGGRVAGQRVLVAPRNALELGQGFRTSDSGAWLSAGTACARKLAAYFHDGLRENSFARQRV